MAVRNVAQIDLADPSEAAEVLLACCASRQWAAAVADGRPYGTVEALVAASDVVLAGLDWSEVLVALDAHPRIGERVAGADREASWSRAEQAGAATVAQQTRDDLVAGNRAYEQRFGYVFLICATGLTAEQMLAALTSRLANPPDVEQHVVRRELAAIVRLRLGKAVDGLAR